MNAIFITLKTINKKYMNKYIASHKNIPQCVNSVGEVINYKMHGKNYYNILLCIIYVQKINI